MDSTPPRTKRRFDVESPKRRSTRNPGRDGGLAGRLAPSPVPGRSSGEAYFGPHDFGPALHDHPMDDREAVLGEEINDDPGFERA